MKSFKVLRQAEENKFQTLLFQSMSISCVVASHSPFNLLFSHVCKSCCLIFDIFDLVRTTVFLSFATNCYPSGLSKWLFLRLSIMVMFPEYMSNTNMLSRPNYSC